MRAMKWFMNKILDNSLNNYLSKAQLKELVRSLPAPGAVPWRYGHASARVESSDSPLCPLFALRTRAVSRAERRGGLHRRRRRACRLRGLARPRRAARSGKRVRAAVRGGSVAITQGRLCTCFAHPLPLASRTRARRRQRARCSAEQRAAREARASPARPPPHASLCSAASARIASRSSPRSACASRGLNLFRTQTRPGASAGSSRPLAQRMARVRSRSRELACSDAAAGGAGGHQSRDSPLSHALRSPRARAPGAAGTKSRAKRSARDAGGGGGEGVRPASGACAARRARSVACASD